MTRYMLVTDDDPVLLSLYRRLFGKCENLCIDYAATSAACQDLIAQQTYDVALIDISLGEESSDGFCLLKEIRAKSPQTDVLMMSSMDSPATVDRCLTLGATKFASKNHDFFRHLFDEVETLLEKRSTHPSMAATSASAPTPR